jgi:hypothetical protein
MSDTPRNKVNILAICAANTSDADQKIQEAKKAKLTAEEQIELIKQQFTQELAAANAELRKNATLIEDVVREGLDSQKLEKKADDIKARIKRLQDEQGSSKAAEAAKEAIAKAEKALVEAEELLAACKTKTVQAELLRASYEINNACGAVEAPEYETLDEAINEYIDNVPMVVSISEEMNIDKVVLWQVPNASKPTILDIHAKKGKVFRYNRMPDSLAWLKGFPNSEYSSMPRGDAAVFQAGGLPFVVRGKEVEDDVSEEVEDDVTADDGKAAPSPKWIGVMTSYFTDNHFYGRAVIKTPPPSIFAPQGMKFFTRSGLCYIKSEAKFYCQWNNEFNGIRTVTKRVSKSDRYGRESEVEEQAQETYDMDISQLAEDFFAPMSKKLKASTAEFNDLLGAKKPLAVRLRDAVQAVGVLESTFEHRNKRLTSSEVAKEVGAYWDAFINAPWEWVLTADVAMMKHLCERKIETPHVWSYSVKGHYGLRVRTRDHDWITARMYCPPESLAPSQPIPQDSVVYVRNVKGWCDELIKAGQCYIIIEGRSK